MNGAPELYHDHTEIYGSGNDGENEPGEYQRLLETLRFTVSRMFPGETDLPLVEIKSSETVVAMNLAIEVISDVICPWCFVGKRRLEKAIASTGSEHDVQVHWLPFQLNPAMPEQGISRKDYRTRKFGSWQRSQELDDNLSAVGEAEGIAFNFGRIERTPNTVDAHRVIWLAGQHGCQDAVVEALFAAYFTAGRDVGNRQTLIQIGTESGLQRHAVESMLGSDDGLQSIRDSRKVNQQRQVSSVPLFVINNKSTLSGAQQPETFLDAFTQVTAT